MRLESSIVTRDPLPTVAGLTSKSPSPIAVKLVPEVLLETISAWRIAFPNLKAILHENPSNDKDDRYYVGLEGDDISVELERHVSVNITNQVSRSAFKRSLPPRPVCDGLNFTRQTFNVDVTSTGAVSATVLANWKSYLFQNPMLDRRFTSISLAGELRSRIGLSDEELETFLLHRSRSPCEPLRSIHISSPNTLRIDRLKGFLALLPPNLRSLSLEPASILPGEWHLIINEVVKSIPLLTNLTIIDLENPLHRFNFLPLSGLSNLRHFSFSSAPADVQNPVDLVLLARWVHQMGGRNCIYRISGHHDRQQLL